MSDDDYDYMFYVETLLNSGGSTSINVTGKDPLRFQDPIQIYTRWITPALVPAHQYKPCARIKWDCHCTIT